MLNFSDIIALFWTDGLVKYMRSQVGPASKELTSVEVAEAFLAAPEVSVVYFGGESKLKGKVQYRFVMV